MTATNRTREEYLVRYRVGVLEEVLTDLKTALARAGCPPAAAHVLTAYNGGRGFMYDVADATDALGPEYELVDARSAAARAQAVARFRAAADRIARREGRTQMAAYLKARNRHPRLYAAAYGTPPPPVKTSPQWELAEAAAVVRAALGTTDPTEMERLDAQVSLRRRALSGDEDARRELEAMRPTIVRGEKVLRAASGGGKARAEKYPAPSEYQRAAAQLRKDHPDWSVRSIAAEVAAELGVALRTAQRYVPKK